MWERDHPESERAVDMRMTARNGVLQGLLDWLSGSFGVVRGSVARLSESVAGLPGATAVSRGAAVGRGSVAALVAALLLTVVAVPSVSAQFWEPFKFSRGLLRIQGRAVRAFVGRLGRETGIVYHV